jgi:hypothetical protein
VFQLLDHAPSKDYRYSEVSHVRLGVRGSYHGDGSRYPSGH